MGAATMGQLGQARCHLACGLPAGLTLARPGTGVLGTASSHPCGLPTALSSALSGENLLIE